MFHRLTAPNLNPRMFHRPTAPDLNPRLLRRPADASRAQLEFADVALARAKRRGPRKPFRRCDG
jgi:hypothetical protein